MTIPQSSDARTVQDAATLRSVWYPGLVGSGRKLKEVQLSFRSGDILDPNTHAWSHGLQVYKGFHTFKGHSLDFPSLLHVTSS